MIPFFIAVILLSVLTNTSLAFTKISSISTRPGVTVSFLAVTPDTAQSRNALILFPGGNGAGMFKRTDDGSISSWSFLIRSSEYFVRHGLATFAVAPPSDHPTGMSNSFRESFEHAEDIAHVADYLERQGYERIFLVGNSRGTLSAASLGIRLKSSRLKGVILTSTVEYETFMHWLPLEQLQFPVLMIHHRNDACRISSFEAAEKTRAILKTTTSVAFAEVSGGVEPLSEPCDNLSAHGFFGVEEHVVKTIADWIAGRNVEQADPGGPKGHGSN